MRVRSVRRPGPAGRVRGHRRGAGRVRRGAAPSRGRQLRCRTSCRRRGRSCSTASTTPPRCATASAAGRPSRRRRRGRARRAAGPLRRPRPGAGRRALGPRASTRWSAAPGRGVHRHVLRVRARLRLPHRAARRAAVPRLEEPRSKVPPGSVGLAGTFTGVYPRVVPGGWQLIGTPTPRCGTSTASRRRCWPRAPGCGSSMAERTLDARGHRRRAAGDRPGPRPAGPGAPRRAAVGRPRRAGAPAGQPPGRQRRSGGDARVPRRRVAFRAQTRGDARRHRRPGAGARRRPGACWGTRSSVPAGAPWSRSGARPRAAGLRRRRRRDRRRAGARVALDRPALRPRSAAGRGRRPAASVPTGEPPPGRGRPRRPGPCCGCGSGRATTGSTPTRWARSTASSYVVGECVQPDRAAARGRSRSGGASKEELPSEGMVLGAVQVPPTGSRWCSWTTTRRRAATRSSAWSWRRPASAPSCGRATRSLFGWC